MSQPEVQIGKVAEYTPELSAGIGLLIPELVKGDDGHPSSEELLKDIIYSPRSALIVAQAGNDYVGTATVNLLPHPRKRKAYLDYVITRADFRGQGIGSRVVLAAGKWALTHGAESMGWTSRNARGFYEQMGAEVVDTTYLHVDLARLHLPE